MPSRVPLPPQRREKDCEYRRGWIQMREMITKLRDVEGTPLGRELKGRWTAEARADEELQQHRADLAAIESGSQ